MIDFSKQITDLYNKPICDGDKNPITLSGLVANAILASLPEDSSLSGKDKIKLFKLAVKISEQSEVSLESEDISTIKDRVSKVYGPLIVGKIWQEIDPNSVL